MYLCLVSYQMGLRNLFITVQRGQMPNLTCDPLLSERTRKREERGEAGYKLRIQLEREDGGLMGREEKNGPSEGKRGQKDVKTTVGMPQGAQSSALSYT